MSSARFEIEKLKLKYKIRQKERGALGGFGSWFLGALSGKPASASLTESLTVGLKESADQFLENPDKLDTIIKAASLLKSPSKSSLGTVVLGSIIGGVLASRLYYKNREEQSSEADLKDQL